MKQGFVTIATGDERYYRMARTLLRSYRQNCSHPMPFAIIADRHNEFTKEFDDVVILEQSTKSWMDKMELLRICPYEENIFIDADCLIYQDINFLWNVFSDADDFSCFGMALPMDATTGWFTRDVEKRYPIHFITHLHGMLYFIRPGQITDRLYAVCQDIIRNYNELPFTGFVGTLADEPVYALGMAILDLKPMERKAEYYCFVPFATQLYTDYYRRVVIFSNPKDGDVSRCCVVHWGNKNTLKYQYRTDAFIVNDLAENGSGKKLSQAILYRFGLLRFGYWTDDTFKAAQKWVTWFFERVFVKLKMILH